MILAGMGAAAWSILAVQARIDIKFSSAQAAAGVGFWVTMAAPGTL